MLPATFLAISRRSFLRRAIGGTALLLAPFGAAFAQPSGTRSLSFAHTHTGESLSVDYFIDDAYQPAALAQVKHFLRDFRTDEEHEIDPRLLDILHDLQGLVARDVTYEVISAYRSPQTNAKLREASNGVAEHSLHIQGRAIDVRISKFSTLKLRDYALSLKSGGVGYYAGSDFVHLDTGRVRSWVA
jgi:uncharacterized protein YcbK (DUF882 family)